MMRWDDAPGAAMLVLAAGLAFGSWCAPSFAQAPATTGPGSADALRVVPPAGTEAPDGNAPVEATPQPAPVEQPTPSVPSTSHDVQDVQDLPGDAKPAAAMPQENAAPREGAADGGGEPSGGSVVPGEPADAATATTAQPDDAEPARGENPTASEAVRGAGGDDGQAASAPQADGAEPEEGTTANDANIGTPPSAAAPGAGKDDGQAGGVQADQKTEPQAVQPQRAREDERQPEKPRLVVSSWSGAYGAAQREAIIAPIEQEMGITVERRSGRGAGSGPADAVELDQANLLRACREGRLLKVSDWPGGGVASGDVSENDFLIPTAGGCGLPSFAWSSIVVVNRTEMKKLAGRRYREPGEIGDLVNLKRYPGGRVFLKTPQRLLEVMLLAGGVARDRVYDVLATRAGEDQAFETLDGIKSSIVWVSDAREALAALGDGRGTMATVFSGRAFRRLVQSDLKAIWDGHIMNYAAWALPRAGHDPEKAAQFIRAAVGPERLAAQARLWPYGPMRRSAVVLARRHALLGIELDLYMPTSELRFEQGLIFNARFWADNGERIEQRFKDWLDGVPMGIRVPPPRQAPPPPLPPLPRQASVE